MSKEIVHSLEPVTLVGGGEASVADLHAALALAPRLVAADGGAALPLQERLMPEAVIGDLDSLSDLDRGRIAADRLFHIAEQDSTDFEKALGNISAPVILGVGFLGARVDHQLAAFHSLLSFAHRACVLLGAEELVFLAPPQIALDLEAGNTVSLFPLRRVTGRSTGLEWPIDDLVFEPGVQSGTSNRATGPVMLEVDQPGLLVIVPRAALGQVTQALAASAGAGRGPWPVRAG
ncbi:MAG: thiamine diphosphokinase [Paracoccaceae bacterium]